MIESIESVFTNFVSFGSNYNEANRRLETSLVGTSNKFIDLAGGLAYNQGLIGEAASNVNQSLQYRLYQSSYKFDIPYHKIKTLNSARLSFNAERVSNNSSPLKVNIKPIPAIKRYSPPIKSKPLPFVANFNPTGNNNAFDLVIDKNSINSYELKLLFVVDKQELEQQDISVPNVIGQEFYNAFILSSVALRLDYEEQNAASDGFEHYSLQNSSFINQKPNIGNSIYLEKSGFINKAMPEALGAVVLYPGSGHRLRIYDIFCQSRALRFPTGESKTIPVELVIKPGHVGKGIINICRWNSEPSPTSNDFSTVATLPEIGGSAILAIEPNIRWFHFSQLNPEEGYEQPIRIAEENGKLVTMGF